MEIIKIEHKVLGSLQTSMGDCILSATRDSWQMAETFMSNFVGSNSKASPDYATILMFVNPYREKFSILHYQAAAVACPAHNRSYDTRALYEIEPSEFSKCNYSYATVLGSLSQMRAYDSTDLQADNRVEVPSFPSQALTSREKALFDLLSECIMTGKRLFLHLGDSDKLKGDRVRQSPKLKSILNAVNAFPKEVKSNIGIAYAVENNAEGMTMALPYLAVVAHFDAPDKWDASSNAICVNWLEDDLPSQQQLEQQIDSGVLSTMPCYEEGKPMPFSDWTEVYKERLELIRNAVEGKEISDKDLELLCNMFNANSDNTDLALALLRLSLKGIIKDVELEALCQKVKGEDIKSLFLEDSSIESYDTSALIKLYEIVSDCRKIIIDSVVKSPIVLDKLNSKGSGSQLYSDLKDKVKGMFKKLRPGEQLEKLISNENLSYYGLGFGDVKCSKWGDYDQLVERINQKEIQVFLSPPDPSNAEGIVSKNVYDYLERLGYEDLEKIREKIIKDYGEYDPINKWPIEYNKLEQKEIESILGIIKDSKELLEDRSDDVCKLMDKLSDCKNLDSSLLNLYAFTKLNKDVLKPNDISEKLGNDVWTPELLDYLKDNKYLAWNDIPEKERPKDNLKRIKDLYEVSTNTGWREKIFKGLCSKFEQLDKCAEFFAKYPWIKSDEFVQEYIKDVERIGKRSFCKRKIKRISKSGNQDLSDALQDKFDELDKLKPYNGICQKIKANLKPILPFDKKKWFTVAAIIVFLIFASLAFLFIRSNKDSEAPVSSAKSCVKPRLMDSLFVRMYTDSNIKGDFDAMTLDSTHIMVLVADHFLDMLCECTIDTIFVDMLVKQSGMTTDTSIKITDVLHTKSFAKLDSVFGNYIKANQFEPLVLIGSNDTILLSDDQRLMSYSVENIVSKVIMKENEFDISNDDFSMLNAGQSDLTNTLYYLWVVKQLDSLQHVNNWETINY